MIQIKHFVLSILLIFISCNYISAQVSAVDSVEMGAGYANDVWYSLSKGVVKTAPASEWDLAFQIEAREAGVRINGAKNLQLYLVSDKLEDWDKIDTTGKLNPTKQLLNSDTSWNYGAFNVMRNYKDPFDYGWGKYDRNKNIVVGSKIFVLSMQGKSFIKIRIDSIDNGASRFKMTYSKLGGKDTVIYIDRTKFPKRNFAYFSFENNKVFDREPDNELWDLTFNRYISIVSGIPYPVAGVLHNHTRTFFSNEGVFSSQKSKTDTSIINDKDVQYSSEINTIGHDWKEFNQALSKWIIQDSLVFFVSALDKNIYKMVFTDFNGALSGKFVFKKKFIRTVSRSEIQSISTKIYPNPTNDFIKVELESSEIYNFKIVDVSGKLIKQGSQSSNIINISDILTGIYFLEIETREGKHLSKIIKN